jgi:hypothetical protein
MNPFEQHYQDKLEAIELNGVTFHVRLPTKDNKRFQRAVASELIDFDLDTGEYTQKNVTAEKLVEIQIAAFIATCIRKVEGWTDYTSEKLLAIPDACEDLWEIVGQRTTKTDSEADAEIKKSASLSDGPASGQDGGTFTPNLKEMAS